MIDVDHPVTVFEHRKLIDAITIKIACERSSADHTEASLFAGFRNDSRIFVGRSEGPHSIVQIEPLPVFVLQMADLSPNRIAFAYTSWLAAVNDAQMPSVRINATAGCLWVSFKQTSRVTNQFSSGNSLSSKQSWE